MPDQPKQVFNIEVLRNWLNSLAASFNTPTGVESTSAVSQRYKFALDEIQRRLTADFGKPYAKPCGAALKAAMALAKDKIGFLSAVAGAASGIKDYGKGTGKLTPGKNGAAVGPNYSL